jgi:hypothetical protein
MEQYTSAFPARHNRKKIENSNFPFGRKRAKQGAGPATLAMSVREKRAAIAGR